MRIARGGVGDGFFFADFVEEEGFEDLGGKFGYCLVAEGEVGLLVYVVDDKALRGLHLFLKADYACAFCPRHHIFAQ